MTDSGTRIYAYSDPVKFLSAELKRLKLEDKGFSLREWSRRLGYENPSYLSDVIKGKRKLKISMAVLIARSLGLDEKATRYLEVMALVHQTKDMAEKRHLSKLLSSLRPKEMKNSTALTMEQFALIADWHNWAIAEMPRLRGFSSDLKYISGKLGNEIPKEAIEESIELLLKNRILTRDEKGNIKRTGGGPDFIEPEISKLAAREYQKQMAKKALESLKKQKSEEIDFQGSTFCIKFSDIPELRKVIREFHQKILSMSVKEDEGDEVYQLNSQLFRLT